jgi:ABC-type nitrate/sulfonate/bicarbonate transport system substrate-binding protein
LARRNGFAVHDDIVAEAVHEASGGTVDAAITLVLVARHDYTGRHPEVISAFRRSLNEAIVYLAGHDAEARTTMQEWPAHPRGQQAVKAHSSR